ncbi:hypothetical protein [Roseivivax marinus]|uniref:hypothetical protein n=1 Tax=Roseivivax marinus TaxID=1379903 RepID=UPI00273F40B3|nr:hypothetical protein [Roseivivax marinus]
MRRNIGAATILAMTALATTAVAEEHEVVMLGAGFFPEIIHPVPGDTVVFTNAADLPMAATATDESWTTGLIAAGATYTLAITEGMTKTYDDSVVAAVLTDTTTSEGTTAEGTTSEDPATEETATTDDGTATSEESTVTEPAGTIAGIIEWEEPAPILLDETGNPVEVADDSTTTTTQ